MVSGFQFAIGAVCRIGFVVKAAVGQRATEALVEEHEQERHLNAFGCEAVGVMVVLATQQTMAFEFADRSGVGSAGTPWPRVERW